MTDAFFRFHSCSFKERKKEKDNSPLRATLELFLFAP